MDILKTALDWAKAEVFSTQFFIICGIAFLLASLGFWQLAKTETAKAFILPTLVAGILLIIIGAGLVFSNKSRIASFPSAYSENATAFIQAEIARSEKAMDEYKTIVFKIIPAIIIIAALLIIFSNTPTWRAIGMTTIAMLLVIIIIDSNANARIESYKNQLELVNK